MTNGDRLRQMTDEELAKFWCEHTLVSCEKCAFNNSDNDECEIDEWLKQESEDTE